MFTLWRLFTSTSLVSSPKDGANLEFHSNRILKQISSKCLIWSENQIRIFSGFKFHSNTERCWDVLPGRGVTPWASPCWSHWHRGHPHRSFWPNHENDFLQSPNLSSHTLCTYTHTRLENKIVYLPVKNKIKKTNPSRAKLDTIYGSYAELDPYSNISNLSQVLLIKWLFKFWFMLTLK